MDGNRDNTTIAVDPAKTYTKAGVAELFGVSTKTVDRWRKGRRKQIPAPFHIGQQPYWHGEALRRFIERKQAEVAA